ncbi:DUF397 domain-containing protein [Micromonospora matsumotoense]
MAGDLDGLVAVRDSRDPTGLALAFAPTAWTAFAKATKHTA